MTSHCPENMFILNETTKNDPAVQMALESFTKQLQKDYQQTQDIRSGKVKSIPSTSWNISDRD